MPEPVKIVVYRTTLVRLPGRYTRSAFGNHYECTGPDGRRFTNTSLTTLRDVLKRRYGKVNVSVVDQRA